MIDEILLTPTKMAVFEQKAPNKVTLDDTVPLSCRIEAAHTVKDHTEYIIRVQRGPVSENNWTVSRRYSDFAALDTELRVANIELLLPPKRVFGNKDREFIAERQQGLQVYLDAILNDHVLGNSVFVKKFLDPESYRFNLQEEALQHISMFFRSEPKWEVIEPAPDIGWRIRKRYFLIKDRNQPKQKYLLSWCQFGPEKFLPTKDLQYLMKLLPTFQHPNLYPCQFAMSNETCGIAIRHYKENGSLRDFLCKSKPRIHFLKKYANPKALTACQLQSIQHMGRLILETLKYLHDKGLFYGQLHAGNVIIEDSRPKLAELENSLLGLPSYYRPFFTQFRKIQTLEQVDVYCFGQLLFEMTFGSQLNGATCDNFPFECPAELRSVLESILTTEACKNGIPSLNDLLIHPFFRDVMLPAADRPQIKIPSKLKEAIRECRALTEKRLRDEQKVIHQCRRLSKAQAYHMSDEEKKKRRRKKKQLSVSDAQGDARNGEVRSVSPSAPPQSAPTTPISPTAPEPVPSTPNVPPTVEEETTAE